MDLAFIHIGIAQALFGALIIFMKNPLSIPDKILGYLLIIMSFIFIVNLIKIKLQIDDLWPISVSISILFPPSIYLYSKYVIYKYPRFKLSDYLHFIPFFIAIISIIVISNDQSFNSLKSFSEYFFQQSILMNIVGNLYVVCLWVYGIMAIINIYRYKKQINNIYSFKSQKITLNWLLFLIISYLIISIFIIRISAYHLGNEFIPHIERFRSGSLLFFVYFLCIWGHKQVQLSSNIKPPKLNFPTTTKKETDSEKYKRSGLKKEQAIQYTEDLIDFMNKSKIWKDNELTIAKLSEQTNILSHYITQVLNENLNKNFNTFVNEYRLEYAKKLIKSSKYKSWSFLSISFESGFNSKATFNTFFKKYTGMTPSEFKKNNAN